MCLDRFIGFAIGGKQQIDKQIISNPYVFDIAISGGDKPVRIKFFGSRKEVQGADYSFAVDPGCPDQHIHVLGGAEIAVEAHCLPADQNVFNIFIAKSREEPEQRVL